ncbi:MAG: hypothetical protein ABJC63_11620 [Gemmatimonadales bacterium]
MKGITLTALTLALVSAACQEATTSPQISGVPDLRYSFDNAPPPPIDTGAVGASQDAQSTTYTFQVTYFFNPTGNAGYLKFDKNQDGSTEIDKNAQVNYSQGTFSGKGFVTIAEASGSELVIDLSTVTQASSSFSSCSAPVITPSSTADTRPEGGCFALTFSGVTRNGTATSSPFVLVPGCRNERGIIPCVRPPTEGAA